MHRARHLTVFALLLIATSARAQTPLFDLHVHLWDGEASLREYEKQVKDAGHEIAGLGAMWFGGPNMAQQGQPKEVQAANDSLLALAAKHSKVMPIATVHPYDGQAAIAELERVAARGIKVMKLHPHTQRFDAADPRVQRLVERAGELGVIVMFDNASILPGDCEKLFNLALASPETTFVFAHMGGLNFRFWNVLTAVRTAEGLTTHNMYFDISAIVSIVDGSPIADEFVWTIRNVGVDRIILGSDYPQYSLAQNVSALERLKLDESEKAKIRVENAQRLFGRASASR